MGILSYTLVLLAHFFKDITFLGEFHSIDQTPHGPNDYSTWKKFCFIVIYFLAWKGNVNNSEMVSFD